MEEESLVPRLLAILDELQDEYEKVLNERASIDKTLHMLHMTLRDFTGSVSELHDQHHKLIQRLNEPHMYNASEQALFLEVLSCVICGFKGAPHAKV